MTHKLSCEQLDMLDFINAYGRYSVPRDRYSQRAALILARKGLIGITRKCPCWAVWPIQTTEKVAA
jgi:hypothetical protein